MPTSTESTLKCDRVLFVERSGELIFAARLSNWSYGAAARASLNRAYEVAGIRPETRRPIHVQVEVGVKSHGGPNPRLLKKPGMTCG